MQTGECAGLFFRKKRFGKAEHRSVGTLGVAYCFSNPEGTTRREARGATCCCNGFGKTAKLSNAELGRGFWTGFTESTRMVVRWAAWPTPRDKHWKDNCWLVPNVLFLAFSETPCVGSLAVAAHPLQCENLDVVKNPVVKSVKNCSGYALDSTCPHIL